MSIVSYKPESVFGLSENQVFYGFNCRFVDVSTLAQVMLFYAWSPIVFRGGYRAQKSFIEASWCGLDFDNGEMSLEDAKKRFCDMIHVIGTTKSHRRPKNGVVADRFRVVLLFEEKITDIKTYRWNMRKLLEEYPEADETCKDGARFFWPCTKIVQVEKEGFKREVDKDVPDWFMREPTADEVRSQMKTRALPRWVIARLSRPIEKGKRNITVYKIAKDMTRYGILKEDIVHAILSSPTYRDDLSQETHDEVLKTIGSAWTSVHEILKKESL